MGLDKRYRPNDVEPRLQALWQESGIYHFDPEAEGAIYSIDTPPPTVSGRLHLGHIYSYSQADFMARFWRMNGCDVFYPMGYDDNGLPTERLVERRLGVTATEVGRRAFIERCLAVSEEEEENYEALWQRLGLSIDWRYTYRTIDEHSRRISQLSFLALYRDGLAYHRKAPSIWCPECGTAIAQAELDDLERESAFVSLAFRLEDGETLPIATTRPELLPACVAVFVHPDDDRFRALVGRQVTVPLFGQTVPVLEDPGADPEKGTGAVMCCTFGDTADVEWWYTHDLPLRVVIGRDGRLTEAAGDFAGLSVFEARRRIVHLSPRPLQYKANAIAHQLAPTTGSQNTRVAVNHHGEDSPTTAASKPPVSEPVTTPTAMAIAATASNPCPTEKLRSPPTEGPATQLHAAAGYSNTGEA